VESDSVRRTFAQIFITSSPYTLHVAVNGFFAFRIDPVDGLGVPYCKLIFCSSGFWSLVELEIGSLREPEKERA
jgi:hypothetical protein